jgi:hypothetical protein
MRRYLTAAYDFETKDEDTQGMGMTRPFLGWFYDGERHVHFHQPKYLSDRRWTEAPWLETGGLIDQFMRYVMGLELCGYCEPRVEMAKTESLILFDEKGQYKSVKLCQACHDNRQRYQKKKYRIYAHNAGRFDALFLLPWLKRHTEELDFEISGPESRIQRMDVWPRGSDPKKVGWSFLDSVSILSMSLRAAGKTFLNRDEGKIDLDLNLPEKHPAWLEYNKRDCEVLHGAIEVFNNRVVALGGEVGITAPATAMNLFRRVYLKRPVSRNKHFSSCLGQKSPLDPSVLEQERLAEEEGDLDAEIDRTCHGCAHAFIRRGYYGGRTELFEEEARNVGYYDINNSYGRSMMDPMPGGKMREIGPEQDLAFYRNLRKKHIGFVECEIEIPETCKIPPLPARLGTKLAFPNGKQRGVWDWDELELLFHPRVGGKITKVYRSLWYEQQDIFSEMITTLSGMRTQAKKDKDAGLDFLTKLFINSSYGKFGMRPERGALRVRRLGDPPPDHGRPLDGDPDTAQIFEVPKIVDGPYVIPQIAAHVTALSRVRLFLGMMSVLDQGGRVIYCDTDSIMCVNAVVRPIHDTELGFWKREYPGVLLDGTFVLPKLYQLRMHEPDCNDIECPGCRWTLQFEDHETKEKYSVEITDSTRPEELLHAAKLGSGEELEVTVKKPTVERMKGIPFRMQDEEHFKFMLPKSRGGRGGRVYFEQLTQHRTMIREKLDGPRVYRGVPGESFPASVDALPDTQRAIARVALSQGDPELVSRTAKRIERDLGDLGKQAAADMILAEKYRARFKAVRSSYDKRTMHADGSSSALVTDVVDGRTVLKDYADVSVEGEPSSRMTG